jgi:hypothetical protein
MNGFSISRQASGAAAFICANYILLQVMAYHIPLGEVDKSNAFDVFL